MDEAMQQKQTFMKDRYLKFFMVDFMELSLRKVAYQNAIYCSDRCKMFDNIMDEDLSSKEERLQHSCFEKCLGKHSDSLESALDVLSDHMKTIKQEKDLLEKEGLS